MNPLLQKFALLLALVALTAGCHKNPVAATPPSADAVLAVVRAQMDALNREDLPGTMAALDPASPSFAQSKDMTAKIFQTYDLRYTLQDLAVESITNDEARVRFSQTTEKISGPAFRNNRITGVHTLKKRDGAWKITNTQASKVDYLDK